MISLGADLSLPLWKALHIAGWPTPWPGYITWEHQHRGSQGHIKAVLVGTECLCSTMGRSNRPEQKKPSPFSAE